MRFVRCLEGSVQRHFTTRPEISNMMNLTLIALITCMLLDGRVRHYRVSRFSSDNVAKVEYIVSKFKIRIQDSGFGIRDSEWR